MKQSSKSIIGVLILSLTAMIWGFSFVAQVLGSDSLPPFAFNMIRFVLGALSMLPLCFLAERPKKKSPEEREVHRCKMRKTLIAAVLAGCALFGASTLQQCGIGFIRDPGKAGFITGLYTVLTPVAYWLVFKKKSSWNVWVGCVLAVLGLYLICLKDNFEFHVGIGEILIFLGAFLWAAHILIVDKFSSDVYAFRFSAVQYLVCGGLAGVVFLFTETVTLAQIQSGLGAILMCGILSVGVAYTLQTIGQRMVPPAPAAIILSTEAVFAAVGGVLWNLIAPLHLKVDQTMNWLGFAGCLAMLMGIVLSQLQFSPRQKRLNSRKKE